MLRKIEPKRTRASHLKWLALWLAFGLIIGQPTTSAWAQDDAPERPVTEDLLPESTVMFFQFDNIRDLLEKMKDTNGGKLMANEDMAPLVEGLMEEARTAYADVEGDIGLSMEELQSLPEGEITFAVIAPKRKDLVFCVILETDPGNEAVSKALERVRDEIRKDGEEIEEEENEDGIKIEKFKVDDQVFSTFNRDGMIVACSDEEETAALIDRWEGREVEKIRPLSSNRKFITIMRRCAGNDELTPEFRMYMDPIAFARGVTRGDIGAQFTINLLPILGLDGLLAVGGSGIMNEGDYEGVFHGHVLMANPREGILEMIALKPANYQPEPWIPADATSYSTTSWNLDTMYSELSKILGMTLGEDRMEEWIEDTINSEIEMELKSDILDTLSGRITFVQWVEQPIRINSQINTISLGVKDAEKAQEVIDALFGRFNRDAEEGEEFFEEDSIDGVSFWTTAGRLQERRRERRERRREEGRRLQVEIRNPDACIGLIGDQLVMTDSREFFQKAVQVFSGDAPALVDDEKFQKVQKQMVKLLGTDMPVAMNYSNPQETMRAMFDFANGDDAKMLLEDSEPDEDDEEDEDGRRGRRFLNGIKSVIRDNPLPEFDDVSNLFAPSGGFMTSDETGFHMLFFQLKAEEKDDE